MHHPRDTLVTPVMELSLTRFYDGIFINQTGLTIIVDTAGLFLIPPSAPWLV